MDFLNFQDFHSDRAAVCFSGFTGEVRAEPDKKGCRGLPAKPTLIGFLGSRSGPKSTTRVYACYLFRPAVLCLLITEK